MSTSVNHGANGANGMPAGVTGTATPQENGVTSHSTTAPTSQVCSRRGAEEYDTLLWRIWSHWDEAEPVGRLLGLTSCGRRAGVSTLAANLAIRAADHHLGPVLLVDANVRSPRLRQMMRARKWTGLADVLAGQATFANSVQSTPVPGLELLPLGTLGQWNHIPIDHAQVDALVCECREAYSLVLVDLPAASELGPALPLARALDATVFVVRAEKSARRAVQLSIDRLLNDGIAVLGTVVTDQRQYSPGWLRQLLQ